MLNNLVTNKDKRAFKKKTFTEDPGCGYKLITEDDNQKSTIICLYNIAKKIINENVRFYISEDEVGRNYIGCNNSFVWDHLTSYIKKPGFMFMIYNSFTVHQINPCCELIAKNLNDRLVREIESYIHVNSSFPPCNHSYSELVKPVEILNTIIENIKSEANSPEFKKKLKQYHDQPNKNLISNLKYTRNILDENPEVQVIPIELRQEKYVINSMPTEQEFYDKYRKTKKDFKRFCNNIRSKKKLSEHMLGYTWHFHYTRSTGFSIHLLVMFDGLKLCDDTNLNDIGEYWMNEITGGRGGYYYHSANKDAKKHLGIGLIKSDDADMRKRFEQLVVANSRQSDYFIKINHPLINRTFGRGTIKSTPKTKFI
ncbi:MAG: hypothetical protein ACXVED_19920 [Bacteroidia bacterium]